eukprot:219312-Chlamydomonas_euryale.AAC.2
MSHSYHRGAADREALYRLQQCGTPRDGPKQRAIPRDLLRSGGRVYKALDIPGKGRARGEHARGEHAQGQVAVHRSACPQACPRTAG